MVLFRRKWMWFFTISYFWFASFETNVIFDSTLFFYVHYKITMLSDVGLKITIHDIALFLTLMRFIWEIFFRFSFDFSLTYVGAGMICSHLVNLSLLFGAILSWGVMWPLLADLKGDWYPSSLPEGSMRSLQGYKVCIDI